MSIMNSLEGLVLEEEGTDENHPVKVFTRSVEAAIDVRLHYHKSVEINHFDGAIGELRLGRRTYEIKSLSAIVVPPDLIHSYKLPAQTGTIEVTHISVRHLHQWITEQAIQGFFASVPETRLVWRRDSNGADGPGRIADGATPMSALAHLFTVMELLGSGASTMTVPQHHSWLREVIDRTEKEFAEPIDLESIASTAHLTRSAFARAFRRETGQSYHSYLLQVRLEHAKHMLSEGKTVTEVAAESGFADASHFVRRFRGAFGVTPRRFQQELTTKRTSREAP